MTFAKKEDACRGHRERLRKKLLTAPAVLEDYEILELLLGYVLLRKDTKPLAKNLISTFQTFKGVLDAPLPELIHIAGFGPSLEVFWTLLRESKARYMESPKRQRYSMVSAKEAGEMARHRLLGLPHEEVWAAFVDTQNRLIAWKCLAKGELEHTSITPRNVLTIAYDLKASGFFLAHNHPGGAPRPSQADLHFTKAIIEGAGVLGIRFIDHFIIADDQVISMKSEGCWPTSIKNIP